VLVIKYYAPNRKRTLTEADISSLEQWKNAQENYACARDPRGFLIFLPPDKIRSYDEYLHGDPYTVAENVTDEFHTRRISMTMELVRMAIGEMPDFRILDIGCGEGHITAKIHDSFPSAEISGLDYSVSAIAKASVLYSGIEFIVADAYSPPYCDEYFDIVVCNNLWEHTPDPLHLLAAISRTLKSGGHIVISTPSRYRLRNILKVVRGRPVELMSHMHVTEYSVGQVIEQLRYGGFQVVKVLSHPIGREKGWRELVLAVIGRILRAYLSLIRSHHNLESTVFYLARKTDGPARSATSADGK